ncbi:MAG: hypothetical protein AAFY15_08495, partial [Cyanobacteria bacterium J06648_11]
SNLVLYIKSGLLVAALAVGSAAVAGIEPAEARPAIVERLAEINQAGTAKDHGGLAYSRRTLEDAADRPAGVWTASGDGFSLFGSSDRVGRPAIVQRLAEINLAGTERDHGGLSYNPRTLSGR